MLEKPDLNNPAFLMFPEQAENVKKGLCSICGQKIREEDFKDNLSKKEFSISGMCQNCQDTTFFQKIKYDT